MDTKFNNVITATGSAIINLSPDKHKIWKETLYNDGCYVVEVHHHLFDLLTSDLHISAIMSSDMSASKNSLYLYV